MKGDTPEYVREQNRLRKRRQRLHLRGDHSECLPYCTTIGGGHRHGAIPKPEDCKAGALAYVQPGTITIEEYRRREASGVVHHVPGSPHTDDLVELPSDSWTGGRWAE